MKVIERSLVVLPQSATRIASSLETAATTVAEQGKSFAGEVVTCAASLKEDVKGIVDQMAAIPAMMDPDPIVSCFNEALETAANDLRKLGTDAASIPARLLDQVATVQQVVDEATRTAKSLPGAIPALSKLVPDFDAQLTFFHSLPARGTDLANQARQAIDMFESYGRQLVPLSEQLAQLNPASREIAQNMVAQSDALRNDSLARVQALRDTLQSNVKDLESGLGNTSSKVLAMADGAAQLVRKTGADLMAPLQAQIDFVGRMKDALADEAANCDALFEESAAQLDRADDIVLKPMAEAKARVDAVIDQLKAAAASVDAMLKKALQPIDALEASAGAIRQALDDVVTVVGEEVEQIQGLLSELDADAEKAKAGLMALPENFEPVKAKIAEAIALLEEIKGRIPGFVATANQALDSAASELDQAEALCINAIEVCTRYMMKAPPLMLARTFFMGVKSMIPGVKTSIAAARKSVAAAGTKASGLMDQAIALVEALNPLLDQAIAKVKLAIDKLVDVLVKLQAGLQQVSDTLGGIPPELSKQVETAANAIQGVLDKVRATAEECLAKLQCEALVQRLQEELSSLFERTRDTVDEKIKQAAAPLQQALRKGQEAVAQAAELAQESLNTLNSALVAAQTQAQQPIDQLADLVASGRARISSLNDTAVQQIRQAESQALAVIDQTMQKISALHIEMPGLPAEIQSAVDTYSTLAGQIRAGAAALASQAGSVDSWQSAAQQLNQVIAASVDQAAVEVAQGLAEVKAASDNLRAEAQSAGEEAGNIEATATEVEASMHRMKQEAQSVADSAGEAIAEMESPLQEACSDAETVVEHYAPASEQLTAEANAQIDSATEQAKAIKEAELALAAEIAAAEDNVGQASKNASAQTEALKDAAQESINATLAEVQAVQAQVQAARADVSAAEAIVDAEVVKHGGESARSGQDGAQDGKQDGKQQGAAAASPAANAAAGSAAGSGNAATGAAASETSDGKDAPADTTATASAADENSQAKPASSATASDASTPADGTADAGGAQAGEPESASAETHTPKDEAADTADTLETADGNHAASPSALDGAHKQHRDIASGDTPDDDLQDPLAAAGDGTSGTPVPGDAASLFPAGASKAAPIAAAPTTAAAPAAKQAAASAKDAPGLKADIAQDFKTVPEPAIDLDAKASSKAVPASKSGPPQEAPISSVHAAAADPASIKAAAPEIPAGKAPAESAAVNTVGKEKPIVDTPTGTKLPGKAPDATTTGKAPETEAVDTTTAETGAGQLDPHGLEKSKDALAAAAKAAKPTLPDTEALHALDAAAEKTSSIKDTILSKLTDASS